MFFSEASGINLHGKMVARASVEGRLFGEHHGSRLEMMMTYQEGLLGEYTRSGLKRNCFRVLEDFREKRP